SPRCTTTYTYDTHGNRTSVSSSGYSAANKSAVRNPQSEIAKTAVSEPRAVATGLSDKLKFVEPSDPRVELPTEQLASNNSVESARGTSPTVREGSEAVSDSPPTLRGASKDASRSARTD